MQVIPRRKNYISREPYTLHLWNMKSFCDFKFDEIYTHIFSEDVFHFNNNGISVKISTDSSDNEFVAIISEKKWPSWDEIVKVKEETLGTNIDAILVNRDFHRDIEFFQKRKYKIVIIWEATTITLPNKDLV